MARNVYGLDLGTYEIKVFDKKKDEIWCEKNVIAMKDGKHVFSLGDEAYEMFEKAPENIRVVFPMKNGVIAHFDDMQYLLGNLLGTGRQFAGGAEYVIAVPTDVTEVEKKAFFDLVFHSEARARSVWIVERGLADALGCGIDIMNEKGVFIANFGGGTTELSVLSSGGIVLNRLVKIGGDSFDCAIISQVRHNLEFLIGKMTAERLRKKFGISGQGADRSITVSGRNLVTGVPGQTKIPISLVRAAMKEPVDECARAIRSMIERTPPDVRREIEAAGIYITGGLSEMKGLSSYLRESTGLPVITSPGAKLCAVRGLREIISDKMYYRRLLYSMLDDNYRWLR